MQTLEEILKIQKKDFFKSPYPSLKQSKENQQHFEADALEKPPNIKSVQFLINDATNQMIQYEQKDYGEFLNLMNAKPELLNQEAKYYNNLLNM